MAQNIRALPAVDERVETGAIQFGDDWPGLFIRGDNAFSLSYSLASVLKCLESLEDKGAYWREITDLRALHKEINENVIVGGAPEWLKSPI
jgi:hypothetical protein